MEANKIRHLQHLSSRAGSESVHELIQWHPHGGSDRLGQMGVDLGGPRTPVAQSLLNDPEVDAGFQQMSGVGMAQRVHVGSFGDPALLEGAVEGRLQGTSADGTLPSLPGREQPLGAAMGAPMHAQDLERELRQGDVAVLYRISFLGRGGRVPP